MLGPLAVLVLFWPALASFPAVWASEGFSHSYVVVALTLWLLWAHRDRLRAAPGVCDPSLLVALAATSVFWAAAFVANVRAAHQVAFVAVLTLWGLSVVDRSHRRTLLALSATFFLAVPVWGPLVPVLRSLTLAVAGTLVLLARVPAEIEGDVITIEAGSFLVEDGCAGLNYLLAGLVVGAFYAHALARGTLARLAIVALAGAVAIVGNWLRVFAIVVIGHASDMQSPVVEDHLWLGWVIFALGLVPFFLLAGRIAARAEATSSRDAHASAPRADAPAVAAGGPPEHEGASPPEAVEPGVRARSPSRGRRLATASALAVVGPVLYVGVGLLPEASVPVGGALAPARGWSAAPAGTPRPFSWTPAFVGASAHVSSAFTDGEQHVFVDRLLYDDQLDGAEMIGHPNRIAPEDALLRDAIGLVPGGPERWVRQAVVRAPESPVLVWYWYRVGGVEALTPGRAKLLEVRAFALRRPTAEVVALSAACEAEGCQAAARRLADFLRAFPSPPGIAPLRG